ncbi:MAG TPA: MBL fold metallo-hydrolase [Bryobacteraceae bacterium]|nr:MBL fold metallo-hydrolase [Bryobacteraceae bacterium]
MIAVADLAQARRFAPLLWNRYTEDLKRSVAEAPHRPHPEVWPAAGLHAAWLGHSTVLLHIDGFRILTDPVFSTRIGLGLGPFTLGIKRLVAPALIAGQMEPPDLILLSHAHMDHFDLPSLRALESRKTRVITAAHTEDLLRTKGYRRVDQLGWGDMTQQGDICIRAVEVNHWGARMRSDTHRGFNGYLIETPRYRVLFGGDTAMTEAFRRVRSSRPVDLAIMPIGAYNPWIHAHCTPEQALQMANDAGADRILPVHHQTFQLSSEPSLEPIERLSAALGGTRERLALTEIGHEFHLV